MKTKIKKILGTVLLMAILLPISQEAFAVTSEEQAEITQAFNNAVAACEEGDQDCIDRAADAADTLATDETDAATTTESGDTTSADAPTYKTNEENMGSFNIGDFLTIEGQQGYIQSDKGGSPLMAFLLGIIDFLSKVIGTVAIILVIIGGALMLVSEGDDNKIQKGKTILTQAIIGLIIALSSYILVTFVQSLLYVNTG